MFIVQNTYVGLEIAHNKHLCVGLIYTTNTLMYTFNIIKHISLPINLTAIQAL